MALFSAGCIWWDAEHVPQGRVQEGALTTDSPGVGTASATACSQGSHGVLVSRSASAPAGSPAVRVAMTATWRPSRGSSAHRAALPVSGSPSRWSWAWWWHQVRARVGQPAVGGQERGPVVDGCGLGRVACLDGGVGECADLRHARRQGRAEGRGTGQQREGVALSAQWSPRRHCQVTTMSLPGRGSQPGSSIPSGSFTDARLDWCGCGRGRIGVPGRCDWVRRGLHEGGRDRC